MDGCEMTAVQGQDRPAAPRVFGAPVMALTGGEAVQSRDLGRSEQRQARSARVHPTSSLAETRQDERTVEEKVEATLASVNRRPRMRDILYDLLVYCSNEHTYEEAESFVASHTAYRSSDSSPHTVVSLLVRSGGIDAISYNDQGEVVTPELLAQMRAEGATEDELEDAVVSVGLMVSEAGQQVVDLLDPAARSQALVDGNSERRAVYACILEKLDREPSHFEQISKVVRPLLASVPPSSDGQRLQASFFVDALGDAGAIRWDSQTGWNMTDAGRALLATLIAVEEDGGSCCGEV